MKKIIAVDGPAGAGKSTVSKIVAKKLAYTYIDTGAMYRAVGLKVLLDGGGFDEDSIVDAAHDIDIKLDAAGRVFLDGDDITQKIRTPEIGFVRTKLTRLQREMAAQGSVVMDGRDIGTQVLPNADLKIFLTASVDERARRRCDELKAKGHAADFDTIRDEMILRDKQDSQREIAPLAQAEDAILLDTTNLSIDEVVAQIFELAS